jgi:hypothetical protein
MPNLTLNNLTGSKKQTTVQWSTDATVYPQGWILIESNLPPTANNAQLIKIADGINDWAALPFWVTEGALDAMVVANTPSQSNAFATMLDVPFGTTAGTYAQGDDSRFNTFDMMMGSLASFSPSDSTATFIGLSTPLTPNATDTVRQFQGIDGTIESAIIYVDMLNTLGSNEAVTYALWNVTDAVSVGDLGTITYDRRGNNIRYTGLSLAMDSTKLYSIRITNPAFGTNPTNCYTTVRLKGKV